MPSAYRLTRPDPYGVSVFHIVQLRPGGVLPFRRPPR